MWLEGVRTTTQNAQASATMVVATEVAWTMIANARADVTMAVRTEVEWTMTTSVIIARTVRTEIAYWGRVKNAMKTRIVNQRNIA